MVYTVLLLLSGTALCWSQGDGYIITENRRTLEEIDRLYARIPPVTWTPPENRWKNLPKTLTKIKEGGTLRVVMLGDSIINDISRSCWDLVLENRFPECRIAKVTSVRGSTGCWWYKQNSRVKKFVLDHNPDLVIIGGISHRSDTASVRQVIEQIRKAQPADILLLTGVFGVLEPRKPEVWKQISNPAHYTGYRKELRSLAEETGSAFFDITKPWAEYIRETGKDIDFFKRDPVHANGLGEQTAGRLLSEYLSPPLEGEEFIACCIREAGNAESDRHRFHILKKLRQSPALDERLASDLDHMLSFIRRWIDGKSLWRWFSNPVRRKLSYDFNLSPDSRLKPFTWIYLGRMLVWVTNEYGNVIGYHKERRRFLDKAVSLFRKASSKFPRNDILRMYLGEPVPTDKTYKTPKGAPEWASLQRENLERLADIIVWWIDNRMQENGEYGGGWDDDCEMWRHWVPVMIGFKYPKVSKAQAFFSSAILSQDYMKGGYTSRIYDVEHTSEPSSDAITPMMHLAPDQPVWKRRAKRIAGLMKNRWTGRNRRGFLQFKSTYFSAQKVDPDPKRACDTPYHVVAVQPALLLWLRTADPELEKLFSAWMDTWVDAAARAAHGKPAGIIPAAIRWPSGEVKGPGENWWDPRHHGEPKLYEWPSAVGKMTDALLLTYFMTKKDKYLAPIRSMAACRLNWLKGSRKESPEPGSKKWCGRRLGFLVRTLSKFRHVTGKKEFDELLQLERHLFLKGGSGRGQKRIVDALRSSAEALRINFPGYTREVRFTDRVFTLPRLFGHDMMFPEPVPACNKRPNLRLLYTTATGDRGGFRIFPANAVRWLTIPRGIAALVTESSPTSFRAELYQFGKDPRKMGVEFYLLNPGSYTFKLSRKKDGKAAGEKKQFKVQSQRSRISFTLPARSTCTLFVEKSKE